MADLDIGNEISSGSYGEVFVGVWTLKDRRVAIKRMHFNEKILEEVYRHTHDLICSVHELL